MGNRCGFARGDGRFPSGQAPWFDPDDSSVCSNLVTAPRAFRSRGPFDPTGLSIPRAFRSHGPFDPTGLSIPRAFRSHGPFDPTGLSMSGRPATGQQRGGRSHTLRPASIGFQRLNGSCGTIDRFCCPRTDTASVTGSPRRRKLQPAQTRTSDPSPLSAVHFRRPHSTAPHPLSRRQNRLAAKGGRKRLETLPDEPFT
jgi:hypothetical protein